MDNRKITKAVAAVATVATIMGVGATPANAAGKPIKGTVIDDGQTIDQALKNSTTKLVIKGDRGDIGKGAGSLLPLKAPGYSQGTSQFNINADSSKLNIQKGFMNSDRYLVSNDGSPNLWEDTFYSEDGITIVKNTWKSIEGKWYYFSESGSAAKGWYSLNGKWYHFDWKTGVMTNNWFQGDVMVDRGDWYYLDTESGALVQDAWLHLYDDWFYMDKSGKISKGWLTIGGTAYHFGNDGKMSTGWVENGHMWRYFYSNGQMAQNTTIDGYKLGSAGELI